MELINSLSVFCRFVAISLCFFVLLLAISTFPSAICAMLLVAFVLVAIGFISVLGRFEDRLQNLLEMPEMQSLIKTQLFKCFIIFFDAAMGLCACTILLPCLVIGSKLLGFVDFSNNLDAGLKNFGVM